MAVTSPGRIGRRASGLARGAQGTRWARLFARTGLVSRAVVYALLAYFAFDIAISGGSPAQASGSGALTDIARQPAGTFLLALLSVGLLAYGLWRLSQAVVRSPGGAKSAAKRIGWFASAVVYFVLFGDAISLIVGSGGGNGGPSSHPSPFVARALRWPAGPELVGIVAAGVLIGGVAFAIWACVHRMDKVLETERMSQRSQTAARATGTFGDLTRGVLIGLIGVYLMVGAVTDNPAQAKSLDQVLRTIAHRPYGGWLLGVAALGLLAFSVYSLFEAAYRRI